MDSEVDYRPRTFPETPSVAKQTWRRFALVFKATGIAGVIGFLLIALGHAFRSEAPFWSEIIVEGGKVVVVTSVIGLLFEFLMHEHFVERVRAQVGSVEASIEHLQRTVAITSGAIESGLSAVYSEREQAIDEIGTLLSQANNGDELRIVGISLGDFLCPHGRLYRRLVDALGAGMNVKALLLDMDAEAAHTRAQREEGSDGRAPVFRSADWEGWYHATRCYDELKTASDVARTYVAKYTGSANGCFESRLYRLSPLCFVAIVGTTMFLESYHYAGRGGEAPILKISAGTTRSGKRSRLFEIYTRHFDVLWNLSDTPASGSTT